MGPMCVAAFAPVALGTVFADVLSKLTIWRACWRTSKTMT